MWYKILYRYRSDAPDWTWEIYTKTEDVETAHERWFNCCEIRPRAEVKLVKEEELRRRIL